MEYAYLTDTGKVRDHNEDSVTIVKNNNGEILMAVADGMGGHQAGEVASSIAISHIGKRFSEISSLGTKEEAINWIKDVVSEANVLIYEYTQEHPESMGMGTTLVTSLITSDYLLFGNIGDSSGFVLKNEKLHKITTDHTLVNLLVKSGELTEEEAKDHPRKNVLMKALGATNTVEMDVFDVDALAIDAMVPLSEMFGYATSLRSNTQGRGNFTMEFDHYEQVPKNIADEIIKKNGGNN